MYNNQGIYHITGDMCYENKIMNTASSTGLDETKVPMNIADERIERKKKGGLKRRKFRCSLSYLINTILILFVAAVFALVELGYIPARKIGFFCKDPSISFDYKGDTISAVCLILVSFILPLLLIIFVEAITHGPHPKGIGRVTWRWYRELLIGLNATLFFTEICKVVAGELRPHFMQTCDPDAGKTCTPGEFVTDYTCTSTGYSSYTVIDSSRSFPSGHASVAMFTSIFCVYYIQIRLRSPWLGMLFKPALITIVSLWGPLAGLSRIVDRRHHWWDVVSGTVLGVAAGFYIIVYLRDQIASKRTANSNKTTTSTTTLFDITNKGATSVII